MTEVEKYIGIYNSNNFKHYGHSNHGKDAFFLIKEWNVKSLLDVGCGHNEFVNAVKKLNIFSIGVDFACPSADIIADATNLPFEEKQFDVLTCFDMLEHLRSNDVDKVLTEFSRVSNRFIFSICYRPSDTKWMGHNLHPTVKDEEWWIDKILKNNGSNIKKIKNYITGNY